MHIIDMEDLMESELAEAVQRHYPLDWKEDSITHDLMIKFRERFHQVVLDGLRYPLQLGWEIYKLHGSREASYGDIGVLIRYRLVSGADIEGAGFLEAKVRGRGSTKFHQVRREQIQRLLSKSIHTRLLMYDYQAVPVHGGDFGVDLDWDWPLHRHWRRVGRAQAHATALV